MFENIWRKLANKEYRESYALSLLKRSVAFQIKTLRKKHCGSQAILAERSHLTQGVVSRAEDQDYGNLTFNTVGRIAAGLDMAFIGRFAPFSDLVKFSEGLSEGALEHIPRFEEEATALGALPAELANFASMGQLKEPSGPFPIGPIRFETETESERQHASAGASDFAARPPRRIPPARETHALHFAQAV